LPVQADIVQHAVREMTELAFGATHRGVALPGGESCRDKTGGLLPKSARRSMGRRLFDAQSISRHFPFSFCADARAADGSARECREAVRADATGFQVFGTGSCGRPCTPGLRRGGPNVAPADAQRRVRSEAVSI
jgi:hypothetical protein